MSRRNVWGALDLTDASPEFRARFWAKVDQKGPDDCWRWTAHCKATGYGQFTISHGNYTTSSRVALALTVGRLEPGQVACHTCDNPPCCNPAHLFVGTQSDNALDASVKGRLNTVHGEAAPSARLTEQDVRAIRAVPERRGATTELARTYGVSTTTIRKIRRGTKWRYLLSDSEAAA